MSFLPPFFRMLSLLTLVCLCALSCKKGPAGNYQTTDSGLTYQFNVDKGGETAVPGDRVLYHISFRKDTTTVTSSRAQGFPIDIRLPKEPAQIEGNFLLEAIMLMSAGDSLSYYRPVDSLPANARPPAFESGDLIYFDIQLFEVQKEADYNQAVEQLLAGMTPLNEGGWYFKVTKDAEGDLPNAEDGIRYDIAVREWENVVYSTAQLGNANSLQLPAASEAEKARSENPILDALMKMSVGDEMTLAILADSLRNTLRPEWGFQPGDIVQMDLKLLETKTKAELEAEREEQQKLQEAAMAEQEAAIAASQAKGEEVSTMTQEAIKIYLAGNLKEQEHSSGLKYHLVRKGEGPEAEPGDQVVVHYSGHLENGERFDASFLKGTPYPFVLGKGAVIKGWDVGIDLMREGDVGYLFIPAEMGYGEMGSPPRIPANANLVFYVEVEKVNKAN